MKRLINPSPPASGIRGIAWQAIVLGALLAISAGAQAQTAVGSTVSNIAKLSYDVAGTPQSPICSSSTGNTLPDPGGIGVACTTGGLTSFLVDLKVNLLVVEVGSSPTNVAPGAANQVTTFTVTNTSNRTLDFALVANGSIASGQTVTLGGLLTDNADTNACSQFVESGTTAGYQALEDTAVFVDELAAGASKTVYAICSIPGGASPTAVMLVSMTATARGDMTGTNGTYSPSGGALGAVLVQTVGANTANVDVVFADGAGSDDVAGAANFSARDAYVVASAILTVTKTAALVCDPVTGNVNPKNIPGAVTKWTITIANTGAASATLAQIADALNANTTMDPDLITSVAAPASCEFGAAGAGTPTSGNGRGVNLRNSTARPMLGTPGGTVTSSFFTGAADADGVTFTAPNLLITFGTAFPAGGAYTAGELKVGETATVIFNAGIN